MRLPRERRRREVSFRRDPPGSFSPAATMPDGTWSARSRGLPDDLRGVLVLRQTKRIRTTRSPHCLGVTPGASRVRLSRGQTLERSSARSHMTWSLRIPRRTSCGVRHSRLLGRASSVPSAGTSSPAALSRDCGVLRAVEGVAHDANRRQAARADRHLTLRGGPHDPAHG